VDREESVCSIKDRQREKDCAFNFADVMPQTCAKRAEYHE
jgi:hypothetical protein